MDYEDAITQIRKSIKTINDEMGDIRDTLGEMRGEMRWIRLILAGLLATVIGQYFV